MRIALHALTITFIILASIPESYGGQRRRKIGELSPGAKKVDELSKRVSNGLSELSRIREQIQNKANPNCALCKNLLTSMVDGCDRIDREVRYDIMNSHLERYANAQDAAIRLYGANDKKIAALIKTYREKLSSTPANSLCGKKSCHEKPGSITNPYDIPPELPITLDEIENQKKELAEQKAKDALYEEQIDNALATLPNGVMKELVSLKRKINSKSDFLSFLIQLNDANKKGELTIGLIESGLKVLNVTLNQSQRMGLISSIRSSSSEGMNEEVKDEVIRNAYETAKTFEDLKSGAITNTDDGLAKDMYFNDVYSQKKK